MLINCLDNMTWIRLKTPGLIPMGRAYHSAVLFGADMLVFGFETKLLDF
jgi:hypothetical protein